MRRPTLVFGELLQDLDTTQGRVVSYTMYILNITFISLYVVGTFSFAKSYSDAIIIFEFVLALIFTFEYISRLDYAEDAIEKATSLYSIADALAILPALLVVLIPVLGQITVLRSVQVLRIFRFVRIGLENDRFFNYNLDGRQVVAAEILTTIVLILFIHAGLVLSFENGVNPDFQNFGDAFYYSIVALTTTGFGNVVPQTTLGNLVTGIGLILSITLIPWLAFRARQIGLSGDKKCQRCDEVSHSQDANYCHKCGEELEE